MALQPLAGTQPAGHSNAHLLGLAPYDNESGDSQPLAYMEPQPSPCFASAAAAALDHDDPDAILPTAITTPPASTKVDPPGTRYIDSFPSQSFAGRAYSTGRTAFDETADKETSQSGHLWESFANEDDWKLAQWLVKNVGHNQAEEFLKLNTIKTNVAPSFSNKDKLYAAVDALPGGVAWKRKEVSQTGDLTSSDGKPLVEVMEVWYRDPVECVRELIGNPLFKNVMAYAPEKVYEDMGGDVRVTDETWTADWWWKLQESLPKGSTIAPIILSSDKTQLSQFRGDKSAWPVYLTIANISKATRRQPTKHATVLLGYLPVGKLAAFSDKARPLAKYQMFHSCMAVILDELVNAGREGVMMTCADRRIRRIWPILAAYVADYPEQCLVAACMENRCPTGNVIPESRGEYEECTHRDLQETLSLLQAHKDGTLTETQKDRFKTLGLRAIHEPFWKHLPHSNIFHCFTPDLLHQLHKGVFKDHLVKWCTNLVGEKELDSRFMSTPSLQGLRHFKTGISKVSQWTGHEHKEMERVFLCLVAGAVDERVVQAVRALMDFITLASLHSHTSQTLSLLRNSLRKFHSLKNVFIELEARLPPHFNIPKYHMMLHYVDLIEQLGTADGFNTEWSERLHIDYAKDAYRASNKKDYIAQMTKWLSRQETVDRFAIYLEWRRNGEYLPLDLEPLTANRTLMASTRDNLNVASTASTITPSTRILCRPPVRPELYHVAASHPQSLRGIPAAEIITHHNALRFLPALSSFLHAHGSLIIPQPVHRFNLYKDLTVLLPGIPQTSMKPLKNIIRASPAVPAAGRKAAEPSHFDFALVRTGETNAVTDCTPLQGIRVAHVRAIFKLPEHYRIDTLHPLVYLEWFTPFHAVDHATGLFTVSRSTRMHQVYGEVVEADRLVRNCHLAPKYPRTKDPSWTKRQMSTYNQLIFMYILSTQ
ncbi:hypothetical protein PHLCEN_2v231 [Hermanssonia centrifuga]|uniref:Uncharacterized protein n=1 Tax=Hermanssonia centrifuga TaxID=98765 RepID=A0A2R6S6M1_9APHY|nr:hypothetical protein PHLCEN_2v231 [Hermanssonia centrifuga]